jgi:hypothetical protein
LYEAPSIALLAEELLQTNGAAFEKIKVSLEQEYYDLSHAQRRLWVLNQFSESRIAYNVPSAYVFEGIVDVGALENAFRALIARHESLRTTFVSVGGTPRQQVHPAQESPFALRYEDLRQLADRHERARELAVAEAQRPFDLGKGPLLRATILHLEDTTYAFLFTLHHIISDGWSMEVLVREVTQLYMGYASGTARTLRVCRPIGGHSSPVSFRCCPSLRTMHARRVRPTTAGCTWNRWARSSARACANWGCGTGPLCSWCCSPLPRRSCTGTPARRTSSLARP